MSACSLPLNFWVTFVSLQPQTLLRYLGDEWADKHPGAGTYDVSDWEQYTPSDIPHQHNGCDCGVFTCMYACFLSMGGALSFEQQNMPHIRQWMTLRLLNLDLD